MYYNTIFAVSLLNNSNDVNTLSIGNLILSLLLAFILSSVVGQFYRKYARTLSNHDVLADIFPLLSIITTLIISVVKSSLALSLGLVGALSIVRFRTPIKEPEELTYIFFSIAIGLALGADQYYAAVIGTTISLIGIIVKDKINKRKKFKINSSLKIFIENINCSDINDFILILKDSCGAIEFTNLTLNNTDDSNNLSMVVNIESYSFESIKIITNEINERFKNCTLNIIDGETF